MTAPGPAALTPVRSYAAGDFVALAAPLVVGGLGSIPTFRAIPKWYGGLDKPGWNPPDAVFGPVWMTLYAMMGIALVLVRRAGRDERLDRAQAAFGLQLALNLAWSFAFFGSRSLRGGLVVIAMLWLAIVATIGAFWQIRPAAALLLLPYLGWVSFASILNAELARRNDALGSAMNGDR
ncbi:MAG: TspO/MBR family protein [Chloroflexota bacterium]